MVKPKLLDQVRDAIGQKDRSTILPLDAKDTLGTYLEKVKAIHEKDLEAGFGRVQFPFALKKKYPNANREWAWQCFCHSERSEESYFWRKLECLQQENIMFTL